MADSGVEVEEWVAEGKGGADSWSARTILVSVFKILTTRRCVVADLLDSGCVCEVEDGVECYPSCGGYDFGAVKDNRIVLKLSYPACACYTGSNILAVLSKIHHEHRNAPENHLGSEREWPEGLGHIA